MSPVASPSKDKYGDRFIPSRAGASWHINFNIPKVRIVKKKLSLIIIIVWKHASTKDMI